jgi:hypothetical protein
VPLEGFTGQPPTPLNRRSRPRQPHQNFDDFSKSLEILKTSYIVKNTWIITIIVLFFRSCGVKVLKFQVERLSGVSGWAVILLAYSLIAAASFQAVHGASSLEIKPQFYHHPYPSWVKVPGLIYFDVELCWRPLLQAWRDMRQHITDHQRSQLWFSLAFTYP